jgi:multicomponent Na+:H+ antiporter subunit C
MIELFLARYIYLLVLVLLAIGLYGVLAKSNLVKKVIGLTIFSTAIYLFFIEGSLQLDGTAPVIDDRGSDPALYVDPLPHLLILTAIVVGVGVVGVALSLLVRIYRSHGSLDETVVAARLARGATPLVASSDPRDPDATGRHDEVAAPDQGEQAPAIEVELDRNGTPNASGDPTGDSTSERAGDEPNGPSR